MNVDKLQVRSNELDKNTGRIVLPSSPEELAKLGGSIPNTMKQKMAAAAAQRNPQAVMQEQQVVQQPVQPVALATAPSTGSSIFQNIAACLAVLALFLITLLLGVQSFMVNSQLNSQKAEVELLRGMVSTNSNDSLKESLLQMADETAFLREEIVRLNDYFMGEETVEVAEAEPETKQEKK